MPIARRTQAKQSFFGLKMILFSFILSKTTITNLNGILIRFYGFMDNIFIFIIDFSFFFFMNFVSIEKFYLTGMEYNSTENIKTKIETNFLFYLNFERFKAF